MVIGTARRHNFWVWGVAGAMMLASAAAASQSRPNIIFILADDLGYGDLGVYGQLARAAQGLPAIQTPKIDRLAQQGMRFTQFYATPSCGPSRCCLNTGFHKGHTAIRSNDGSPGEPALRTEDITVAEMLKRANYRTCYLGKWHKGGSLDNNTPAYTYGAPQNKGFDESYVYMGAGSDNYYPPQLWRNGVKELIPENANGANGVWSHDLFAQEALRFITENAGQPFYLHVAFTIPHKYLECPNNDPYTTRPWPEIEKRYAAMITRMDADVGRIADLVDSLGIGNDTLIIFTGDNGPQNQEGHSPEFFDSNSYLRGIKFDYWEGGIREPFVARWTGRITAGRTTDLQAALYDFMPTAAEMAGVKTPSGIDGLSFYPMLIGDDARQVRHAYMYTEGDNGGTRTVRMGEWKSPTPGGVSHLYNLASDPSETMNLASTYPGIVAELDMIKQGEHRDGPPPVVTPVLSLTGQVSGSESNYVLDFGTLLRGGPPVTMAFQVKNAAAEYSNLMEGQVNVSGATDPRLTAQGGTYAYLVDGSASDDFTVTLTPSYDGPLTGQKLFITGEKYGYGTALANSPITLTIVGEVTSLVASDFDGDGDVDQEDFGELQLCFSGTGIFYEAGCASRDLTHDGFIDGGDLQALAACMGGPGVRSPCAPL
jgi:arylsulfatase A-like enzyme